MQPTAGELLIGTASYLMNEGIDIAASDIFYYNSVLKYFTQRLLPLMLYRTYQPLSRSQKLFPGRHLETVNV